MLERVRAERPESFLSRAYTKDEVKATYARAIEVLSDMPEEPARRRGKRTSDDGVA